MSGLEKIKQLQMDYQATFDTETGKRVLKHLKAKCYEGKTTFHLDSRQHAFNEGGRAVLLDILNMLSIDIEQMEKTIKENKDNG